MALEHLLFFGPIEALVTVGVLAALARTQPALLEARPAARPLRWLWAGLALLLLLTPLGALAPGTAWGEWSGAQLKAALGYVPGNLEKLGGTWSAAMPGYSTPGVGNTLRRLPARRRRRGGARRRPLLGRGGVPRAPPRRGRGRHRARAGAAPRGAGARSRARPRTPSPAPSPTSWRTRSSPPGAACCSASTRASSSRRWCSSPSPRASCTPSGRCWPSSSVTVVLAAASRVPGALLRPQGLAVGRAAGLARRPAVRALLVHARPSGRSARPLHVHRAGAARRGHAGDPRRGRRGLRAARHLDHALVGPPARPDARCACPMSWSPRWP